MNIIIDSVMKVSGGKFITVEFNNNKGELRKINGRTGVHYKGQPASYRFDAQGKPYFLVWECKSRQFKRIRTDAIKRISCSSTVLFSK